ncbi:peptidoglycan-binding protein [Streptomyces sp. NBC_00250]|uniref:peptidoglycan-binding domain-containing protein n=1 Tax=Streptomyces sp. NBC_00250 TaxID=2903641 RepID=UPI002E2D2F5E|nr:peptidoglycan-binding domain-containing protein [Streptomyces sp. NBC_00250]
MNPDHGAAAGPGTVTGPPDPDPITAALPVPGTPASEAARPGRRGGRWLVVCTALVLVAGCAAAYLAVRPTGDKQVAGTARPTTAAVTRTDLVEQDKVDGTLGFDGSYTITAGSGSGPGTAGGGPSRTSGASNAGANVLTWLPAQGQTIERGQQVYRVDDKPVPLLYGSVPSWRDLKVGVSDGADVQELKENLKALGYGSDLADDKHFSDATAQAVKSWQKAQGRSQTGTVALGDVVVEPTAIRVASVTGTVGAPASGTVLSATGTNRVVSVNLATGKVALAKQGAAVQVQLPGGTTTSGHISDVGTVATAPDNAGRAGPAGNSQAGSGTDNATIKVKVTLDKPADAGRLDGAPVTVLFTSDERKNVLAVPVTSLLATVQGAYAVQVVADDGTTRLVPVTLGIFAGGNVEVTSPDLHEGVKVEVPSS